MYWAIGYFLTAASCALIAACVYRIRRAPPLEKENEPGE
jgi:hypothetical protein